MPIRFACSSCGRKFVAKDEHAGRRSKCPACGGWIEVPVETVPNGNALPREVPPVPIAPQGSEAEKPIRATEPKRETRAWKRVAVRIGLPLAMVGLAGMAGYSLRGTESPDDPQHDRGTNQPQRAVPTRNPKIPPEVSYPVFDEVCLSYKRTVYVRLNTRVSPDVLREIALELKAKETQQYEYTHIYFCLKGNHADMGQGDRSPWARVFFDYGLDVVIMGLTIEEERSLLTNSVKIPDGAEPLGTWIIERWKCRQTIYRIGSDWFLQRVSPGSEEPLVFDLEQIPSPDGMVLKKKSGSERYVIDKDGILKIFDYDGRFICVPRPIDVQPAPL